MICGYCRQQKNKGEAMLLAPNGREPQWACVDCMLGARRDLAEFAALGCPACQASLDAIDAAMRAQGEYERTGHPIALEVTPAGFEHSSECPLSTASG